MKTDGLDWMDRLHKTRQKMEDERKRLVCPRWNGHSD